MKPVTIFSTKYDGSLHRRYQALLLEEAEWGWLTFLNWGEPVEAAKGSWLCRHRILAWHWRDQWWDAELVFDSRGQWLEWYCNIVTPPTLEKGVLRYQDLDLDVVWHRERGLFLDDADEFERHKGEMAYPPDLIQRAWATAEQVRQMIHSGAWRFGEDPQTLRYEQEIARWNGLLT